MAPNNPLPIWGNEKTMNLNTLLLTNIQSSPYFKVQLYELKTYHEVIDEIYYKVSHLEPWEKGSRKTAGQTGMCGGVRGVGAGGIVSSAFCLLYKLFTLRLTKKQVNGLLNHTDSPYIRGLGFMYLRYTQNPSDLWDWFEPYLLDEEEVDVKAGGGCSITIGEMAMQFLVKLDWYATLFPRIPVPIQKEMDVKLKAWRLEQGEVAGGVGNEDDYAGGRGGGGRGRYNDASGGRQQQQQQRYAATNDDVSFGEAERYSNLQRRSPPAKERNDRYTPSHRSPPPKRPERRASPNNDFSRELDRERDRQQRERGEKGYERSRRRDSPSRGRSDKYRERDHPRKRSRSYERSRKHRSRSGSPHQKEKHRSSRSPKRDSYKSSSRYREHRNGYP